jgi:hypothetical protein
VPLAELERDFDFALAAPHLQAGSVVTFVRERHGIAAVRALWAGGLREVGRATGTGPAALEAAWRAELRRHAAEAAALDPRGRVRCEGGGAV